MACGDRKGEGAVFTHQVLENIIVTTATLEAMATMVLSHFKNGLSLRIVLPPIRALLSQRALTKTSMHKVFFTDKPF